jgi:hypothetical protein
MKRLLHGFFIVAISLICLACANPTAPSKDANAPAAPTGVTATAGDGQVVVLWTAVSGATSYKVYYKVGSSASTSDIQAAAAMVIGTGATVTGLINGTEYAFVVVAGNAAGDSAASSPATATPAAATAVPTAPSNPAITAGIGKVTLTWSPVEGATGYRVFYKAGSTATISDTPVATGMISGTTATITGLTGGTQYACIIVATNSIGDGQPSGVVATTTLLDSTTAPATPTIAAIQTSPGKAYVQWGGVEGASDYKVFYKEGKTATTADSPAPPGTLTSPNGYTTTISGLTNGVEYAFILVATNSIGDSPASEPVTATPKLESFTLNASPAASGEIGLQWGMGSVGPKSQVFYKAGFTATIADTRLPDSAINGTMATISGLTNGIRYAFVVYTTDADGVGMSISNVATAVPSLLPPRNCAAVIDAGIVALSWDAVDGALGYRVFYALGSTATTSDAQVPAAAISGTTTTIAGLENEKQYAFIVQGYDAASDGRSSSTINATPTRVPQGLEQWPGNQGEVTIKWPPVTGALSYKVFYKAGTTATTTDIQVPAACINDNIAGIPGLLNGTPYSFIVVSTFADGDSAPCAPITITPLLHSPNLFQPSAGSGQVSISWSSVTGATGYKAYYAIGETATIHDTPVPAAMMGSNTATVTGLESGQQYAFIVVAYDATSESPPSSAKTATPIGPAHSFADAGGAMTAYSNGLSAAMLSADSAASAYYSLSGSTYTLHLNNYASEGYTLNGMLTEVLSPMNLNGAIDMTGGDVTRIVYNNVTGTSGTLVISFIDGSSWTYDYATSGFAQN